MVGGRKPGRRGATLARLSEASVSVGRARDVDRPGSSRMVHAASLHPIGKGAQPWSGRYRHREAHGSVSGLGDLVERMSPTARGTPTVR